MKHQTGRPTRLITVTPRLDYTKLQPARDALAAIRAAAAQLQSDPRFDVDIGVTGDPALRTEELRSVTQGIGVSFAFSILAVSALLLLALRSARVAAVSVGVLLLTLSLTLGFAALFVGALNLVSVAFVVLLVGLGIDFVIHFAMHVIDSRQSGLDMRRALVLTTNDVGGPLALAAVTTSVAFFAFIPTDFAGMAQLGVISGVGVLIAFFVAITVLPAVFSMIPLRSRKAKRAASAERALARARSGPNPFLKMLAALILLAGLGAAALLPQARFDADPMALRNPASPSVVAFSSLFEDPDTTPYRLSALGADRAAADELAERLGALDLVDRAITLSDFEPQDQADKLELIDFSGSGLLFELDMSPTVEPRAARPDGYALLRDTLDDAPAEAPGRPAARRP